MTEQQAPYDYSQYDVDDKVDQSDLLGKISTLADQLKAKNKEIAEAALEVKRVTKARDYIAEVQLPELFEKAGISEIKTRSGLPLKLTDKLFSNLSKERKPAAIAWLDEHGHGGMVKRNVIVAFDKTQEERVTRLLRLIGKGWPNHKVELDVNASTLKAFIKGQLDDGKDIPLDTFGVFQKAVVEISSK